MLHIFRVMRGRPGIMHSVGSTGVTARKYGEQLHIAGAKDIRLKRDGDFWMLIVDEPGIVEVFDDGHVDVSEGS